MMKKTISLIGVLVLGSLTSFALAASDTATVQATVSGKDASGQPVTTVIDTNGNATMKAANKAIAKEVDHGPAKLPKPTTNAQGQTVIISKNADGNTMKTVIDKDGKASIEK